jgi:GDP-L-fucose synthase
MINKSAKIYIAGHTGLFGTAFLCKLNMLGYNNIITRTHADLDLCNSQLTDDFFREEKPEYVFCAAAMVGGIQANSAYMADFTMINLKITCNLIDSAYKYGVKKLLYLGSSCIYPKECPQPIKEDYLLTDSLEPTNEGYALAKIAGVKLCDYYKLQYNSDFISCMPANTYGPNDNYDPKKNHVIPALIQKFHAAKVNGTPVVEIWGTGKARREFIYIDDAAEACIFLMNNYDGPGIVNIGGGEDISIAELAFLIRDIAGFKGEVRFDRSKPDGTPRRILDSSKIQSMGFKAKIPLRQGIEKAYQWYLGNITGNKNA